MINLRRVAASAVAVAFGSMAMFSCSQQDEVAPENQISETVLTGLAEQGYSVEDLQLVNKVLNPLEGGQAEPVYVLEGDINIPVSQMDEFLAPAEVLETPSGEQYRTSNLVSKPRTISVIGYTGGSNALTSRMRTGLQWAINNYNALNLDLTFTLRFATATNADIVVYNNGAGGGGGSAGFPSGGRPYKWVQINNGTSSFSTNVNEHVITHEIGHCIGFRHTDYFNRSLSCGSGGNEGSGGVGAIHIPGTPTGNDTGSIMRACFSGSSNGEFGSNDITALRYLY